jgi:hypothetical protein
MPHQNRYQELSPELDADPFIKIAKEKTGLTDVGGNQFDEPLRKLLDCSAPEVDYPGTSDHSVRRHRAV